MRTKEKPKEQSAAPEPMGIVISGGASRETPPLISAYVWGPAPEPSVRPRGRARRDE